MFRRVCLLAIAVIGISIGIPATASAGSICPNGAFPHDPDAGPGGTGCNVVITVNDGSVTIAIRDQLGYDSTTLGDDNLVGLVNNSTSPISSLSLTGSGIFGFDNDGICTFSFTGSAYCSTPGHGVGPAGGDYRGPTSDFTIADLNTGTVTFSPAVAPGGGSTFFSLEGAPTTGLGVGPPPGLCRGKAVIANTGRSFHNANSTVVGGVQAGMDIIQNSGSKITGTTTPFTPAGLATIPVPTPVTNLGVILIDSGKTMTLPAGDYVASSVTLNGNSTLTATGRVRLWVTSGALVIGGAARPNSGVAADLQFYVNSPTDVHVNSGANVIADVYAPGSNATLIDSTLSGCVIGASVTLNSNGVVNFLP